MEKKVFKFNFRGRELVVEHGEVAKQAHGAVLVRYGDTVVLSTAVAADEATTTSAAQEQEAGTEAQQENQAPHITVLEVFATLLGMMALQVEGETKEKSKDGVGLA